MVFVLLITAPPAHISAWHAYYFAESALKQGHEIKPFFYGDGVAIANTVAAAIEKGEGKTIKAKSVGCNKDGEVVAEFFIEWSFKAKK